LVTSEDTVARRPVDIAATIVLLIGHALALFTYLAVGLSVMGTDPCGAVQCGDQHWVQVSVLTAMIGGLILVIADLIVSAARMAKGRLAWFVPALFCVAQVGVGAAGWAIVSQAGPL
jgi:hypothetical protein